MDSGGARFLKDRSGDVRSRSRRSRSCQNGKTSRARDAADAALPVARGASRRIRGARGARPLRGRRAPVAPAAPAAARAREADAVPRTRSSGSDESALGPAARPRHFGSGPVGPGALLSNNGSADRTGPRRKGGMMARKYGKKASSKVERAMHERKRGTLKSG